MHFFLLLQLQDLMTARIIKYELPGHYVIKNAFSLRVKDAIYELFNVANLDDNCDTVIVIFKKKSGDEFPLEATIRFHNRAGFFTALVEDEQSLQEITKELEKNATGRYASRGNTSKWECAPYAANMSGFKVEFFHKTRPGYGVQKSGFFVKKKTQIELAHEEERLKQIAADRLELEREFRGTLAARVFLESAEKTLGTDLKINDYNHKKHSNFAFWFIFLEIVFFSASFNTAVGAHFLLLLVVFGWICWQK